MFRSPMRYDPDIVKLIVQCCCCLHNFLRSKVLGRHLYTPEGMLDTEDVHNGEMQRGEWRKGPVNGIINFVNQGENRHSNAAINLRDEWCAYFNGTGAVSWQDRMIK
ncbi:nuclease harbi1-like protein [Lasius niger]|uniref:Nuclease harbi1-like protein n=1 Tax=Lasius niger TaxID=67767 RepID=A0A0J7N2C3_LASNI|nr:nuclease harbi1-like protein [Lasius niger]